MSEGTLIQHVTGHGQQHSITIEGYGTYDIPSTHHQMCNPFNLNKKDYTLLGYSTNFRSSTYLDGENKEIKLKPEFLEPEIVKYHNTKSLGIQGHPEFGNCPENTKEIIVYIIKEWFESFDNPVPSTRKWMDIMVDETEFGTYKPQLKKLTVRRPSQMSGGIYQQLVQSEAVKYYNMTADDVRKSWETTRISNVQPVRVGEPGAITNEDSLLDDKPATQYNPVENYLKALEKGYIVGHDPIEKYSTLSFSSTRPGTEANDEKEEIPSEDKQVKVSSDISQIIPTWMRGTHNYKK